ncbi:zinc finger protein 62 homolog isoform X2 [Anthonomus grandis grandis]|nr:zinc finger protein 62 homolog isoform X2 [Anthonomus grandis grandis]
MLPQFICDECFTTLLKCHNFRIKIICSDKVLKEQLSTYPAKKTTSHYNANSPQNFLVDKEIKSECNIGYEENIPTVKEASKKIVERKKAKVKTAITIDGKLECTECLKSFKRLSHLEAHNAYKHLERKFECKLCHKKFARKYDLSYHNRLHTGERPFTCELCGKSFASPGYFLIHKKLHKGDKKAICTICQHRFINTDQLQIHTRQRHTGERPYMCELCSHAFTSSSALSRHKNDVHNEKVNCSICNRFYSKRVLKDHIKRHKEKDDGVKRYICSQCGKGFTCATSRKRHMVVHSGEKPFKCEVCEKSFNQRSTLQTHMRIHSQIRPFGCDICSKSFKFKHHLKLHYEKFHKGEEFIE